LAARAVWDKELHSLALACDDRYLDHASNDISLNSSFFKEKKLCEGNKAEMEDSLAAIEIRASAATLTNPVIAK
jgi:hypothetical protein